MKIFKIIKDSIYNPGYYKEVLQKPFSYSLKYYFIFALLFAVLYCIPLFVWSSISINWFSNEMPGWSNYFPEELVVTIDKGEASVNVEEPYFIKIPESIKGEYVDGTDSLMFDNIIAVDTRDAMDMEQFLSYKSLALLSKDSISFVDNNKISTIPLSDINNVIIDRGLISTILDKVKPLLGYLYPLSLILFFVIGYIIAMWKLVYLLIAALVIWIIAKIMDISPGYKKSYQIGIHLLTLPILITVVLSIIPGIGNLFPFFFSIVLIIMAVLNFKGGAKIKKIADSLA